MNRFSENLDFLLKRPDSAFRWQGYLESVQRDCAQKGIAFEVQDKAEAATAPLTTQTLESSFALKLHALLCRSYVKGRDWYDFVWYVARGIRPDMALLKHAIEQQGQWAGLRTGATWPWLIEHLRTVIGRHATSSSFKER